MFADFEESLGQRATGTLEVLETASRMGTLLVLGGQPHNVLTHRTPLAMRSLVKALASWSRASRSRE